MLTYLDSLCDAMAARDLPRLRDLVEDHPLARLLPADAMSEVRRFLAEKVSVHTVPLVMLRFRDQTARLLSELPRHGATEDEPPAGPATAQRTSSSTGRQRRRRANQMELPLSA
jgi:hypothetical protein